jgi:hypothetical protein
MIDISRDIIGEMLVTDVVGQANVAGERVAIIHLAESNEELDQNIECTGR